MLSALRQQLGLRVGEAGRLAPFALLLGLVSACLRLFQLAVLPPVVAQLGAERLPWIYLLSAPLAAALCLGADRLSARLGAHRAAVLVLIALILSLLGFWVAASLSAAPGLLLAACTWHGSVVALAQLVAWGLVLSRFDNRESKRVIGLLLGAELLGGMVAAGLGGVLVGRVGASGLMLGAALLLAGALAPLRGMAGEDADDEAPEPELAAPGPLGLDPRQAPYSHRLFALATASTLAFYALDMLFYVQLEARYPDAEALARALGLLSALVSGVTLVAVGLAAAPVIARLGVRLSALLSPVALLVGASLLWLVPGMSPGLLIGVWALDRVARDTVEEPSGLLLYQALSPARRLRVQARSEGVVEPLAAALAGVGLLFVPTETAVLELGLLGAALAWVLAAHWTGRGYRTTLAEGLRSRWVGAEALELDDPATLAVVQGQLRSAQRGEVLYALQLLDTPTGPPLPPELVALLEAPWPEVRRTAARVLGLRGEAAALVALERRLEHEPEAEVRAALHRAVVGVSGAVGLERARVLLASPEPVLRLAGLVAMGQSAVPELRRAAGEALDRLAVSPAPSDRRLAVDAAAELGLRGALLSWVHLLQDADAEVVIAVLEALVATREQVHERASVPVAQLLVAELRAGHLGALGEAALGALGLPAVPVILEALAAPHPQDDALLRALRLTGAPAALRRAWFDLGTVGLPVGLPQALRAHLPAASRGTLSRRIDRALAGAAEDCAAALAFAETEAELSRALFAAARARGRRVLLLCSLGPGGRRVQAAAEQLLRRPEAALENLDDLLDPSVRPRVLALVDPDESLAGLARRLRVRPVAPEDWLAALPDHLPEDRWALLCALDCARRRGMQPVLAACAAHPDPAVRATLALEDPMPHETSREPVLLPIEKVLILRSAGIFDGVPERILVAVAEACTVQRLAAAERLFSADEPGDSVFFLVSGSLRVHRGAQTFATMEHRGIIGELAALDPHPRSASVTATSELTLLRLDQAALLGLMRDHPEVAQGVVKVLVRRLRERNLPGGLPGAQDGLS